jgi:hypothetical protein
MHHISLPLVERDQWEQEFWTFSLLLVALLIIQIKMGFSVWEETVFSILVIHQAENMKLITCKTLQTEEAQASPVTTRILPILNIWVVIVALALL